MFTFVRKVIIKNKVKVLKVITSPEGKKEESLFFLEKKRKWTSMLYVIITVQFGKTDFPILYIQL